MSAVTKEGEAPRVCMSRICNKERVVWAKVYGYRPWPARIIQDDERDLEPSYKQADGFRKRGEDTLVVFFGTDDISWLRHDKAVTFWKLGLKRKYHVAPQKNKAFQNAMSEVRKYCSEASGIEF